MNDVTWILIGGAVYCGLMLTYWTIMTLGDKPSPAPVRVLKRPDMFGPKA